MRIALLRVALVWALLAAGYCAGRWDGSRDHVQPSCSGALSAASRAYADGVLFCTAQLAKELDAAAAAGQAWLQVPMSSACAQDYYGGRRHRLTAARRRDVATGRWTRD